MHGKGREPTLPEPKRTRTSAWKKLWPKSDVECDFEESETVSEESVLNEIVSLTKVMGQEMNTNDIHELLEEHNQELTTEELMDLQCVSQQEAVKESLLEKEEDHVISNHGQMMRMIPEQALLSRNFRGAPLRMIERAASLIDDGSSAGSDFGHGALRPLGCDLTTRPRRPHPLW
ncbi:hypothetical protein AVEN_238786-2 [Araneus ventricosus]|uniref:Uncharacterized protein n=1 Tax=Araneus ventricosus TaxID=182803 RepID=A0A4Y2J1H9_ARAVE|nr:hypothetical protein AVEN_238786-2 [Araneus ventricosus]